METNTTPAKAAKPAKTAVSNLTLGNADDALALADELQRFVKANGLTSNIQGKAFPQVEAWQFAGTLLGLSPMLESIEDKSAADEIKWCAMVSIINTRTGATVGRGFATCSNKEHSKRAFADYAICSMAQTRAVGKAYRLSLGWLMKAAGYEATPAEEMQDVGTSAAVVPTLKAEVLAAQTAAVAGRPWTEREFEGALTDHRKQMDDCLSLIQLKETWAGIPAFLKPDLEGYKEARKGGITRDILQAANSPAA